MNNWIVRNKKLTLSILTAFILSIIVTFLSIILHPAINMLNDDLKEAQSVLPSVSLTAANARIEDGYSYIIEAGDAQLYIFGIDEEIGVLSFTFKDALPENTAYQLYYSLDGFGLNESQSIRSTISKSSNNIIIVLPGVRQYDYFRLDIDENYQLTDIRMTADISQCYAHKPYISAILEGMDSFPFVQFGLCFIIMLLQTMLVIWKWDAIKKRVENVRFSIISNKTGIKRSAIFLLVCLLASILAWMLTYAVGIISVKSGYSLFCFILAGMAIGVMIVIRRQLGDHPERGFLVIALCIGLLFAVLEPAATLLSWDDEIHYQYSLGLSYGSAKYFTEAEKTMINRTEPNTVTLNNTQLLNQRLNDFSSEEPYSTHCNLSLSSVSHFPAYLPIACALWLTRLLGVPFTGTVIAGRIANVLCYSIVMFFAIKQLKQGKLLASCLGLIPTMLFMAGNYSYDPFCFAFIMLGTCIWLGVYQDPMTKMTASKTVSMLIAFSLGIMTKAVYFPILLFAFFLPKGKFSSVKKKTYRAMIVLTTLLLISTFVLPLVTGKNTGDSRGGSNISPMGQLQYIFQDPIKYAELLVNYLFNTCFNNQIIMNPVTGNVRALAYVGIQGIVFSEINANLLLFLIVVSWFASVEKDQVSLEKPSYIVKLFCCLFSIGAICLAITSMYCAFTPVGSEIISGFQERYILPAIIPMLLVVRPSFLVNMLPKNKFNAAILGLAGMILLDGMWPLISGYL